MITLSIVAHVVVASVLICAFCLLLAAHYFTSPVRKVPEPGTANRDCYDDYINLRRQIDRAKDLDRIESIEIMITAFTRWYKSVGATNVKALSARLHSELRTKAANIKLSNAKSGVL